MGWEDNTPLLGRLPLRGYQDSALVQAIAGYFDQRLCATRDLLVTFYRNLVPVSAPAYWLDYLAALVGWDAPVWDRLWTPAQKRLILARVAYLQENRGALGPVDYLLSVLAPGAKSLSGSQLLLPFLVGDLLGGGAGAVYVAHPVSAERNSVAWRNSERVRSHWLPCWITSRVCYDRFYVGVSVVGDPLLY